MAGKGIQAKQAVEPREAISGWEPGSESRQAAQRTHSGKTGGEQGGTASRRVGPYLSRGAPSSLQHGPGLQTTRGLWGCSRVLRGRRRHGPRARPSKIPGIVWGGEGGGEGGGNLAGGQTAVSTCLLPAPLPQNRFGQSGVLEGGWNNGSPMPRRSSEGPQTDVLKMGAALLFLLGNRSPPLLELPKSETCFIEWRGFIENLLSLGLLGDPENWAVC